MTLADQRDYKDIAATALRDAEFNNFGFLENSQLSSLARALGLTSKLENLISSGLFVDSIDTYRYKYGSSKTYLRAMSLDAYGNDPNVEKDLESELFLHQRFTEGGLNSSGVFLSVVDFNSPEMVRDIGYFVSYQVSQELNHNGSTRSDIPHLFYAAHIRANWPQIQQYLGEVLGMDGALPIDKIHHWYDYAVPNKLDRSAGYGRLALFLGLEKTLQTSEVAVGFIDSTNEEHAPSIIASLSIPGTFLGPERETSPDGEHPSFLVGYAPGYDLKFTGKIVASKEASRKDIMQFVDVIRNTLSKEENKNLVLGFNPNTNCYELATLHQT